jgi:NAD+-dependent protein deacetylase SIR2
MGQNESRQLVDDSVPPDTLDARTIEALASHLKSDTVKNVVFLVGAGISTAAGIPDFRSPGSGLYSNLAHLDLESPEDVFSIDFFRKNPLPFYTLAHELAPGKFRPTLTHSFMSLLHDKGKLLHVFTQNIDCLEREAGVPEDKLMEAHGSFASSSCINPECKTVYPNDQMRENIKKKEIPYCPKCKELVKPNIVFFGESLPKDFFSKLSLLGDADLAIVMGTSLNVAPFSYLPERISDGVPRFLANRELAGTLGSRADDVLYLGDCDDGIRQLAKACGWIDELEAKWSKTSARDATEIEEGKTADQRIEEEVALLQREIAQTLKIAETHRSSADDQTAKMLEKLREKDQTDGTETSSKQTETKSVDETEGKAGKESELKDTKTPEASTPNEETDALEKDKPVL